LLVERLKEDSISGFRAAAAARCLEAEHLARAGYGTAAVYLWGYVAEMTLKGAYFSWIGFHIQRPIARGDLETAKRDARLKYRIDLGNFHNVYHWALLLLHDRIASGQGYAPDVQREVIRHSHSVYRRWHEALRYKTNRAYLFEVKAMRDSVQWLLDNGRNL
jgi:hypothetical protein